MRKEITNYSCIGPVIKNREKPTMVVVNFSPYEVQSTVNCKGVFILVQKFLHITKNMLKIPKKGLE